MIDVQYWSKVDYEKALQKALELFGAELNTPESFELQSIVQEIEEYEKIHFPIN